MKKIKENKRDRKTTTKKRRKNRPSKKQRTSLHQHGLKHKTNTEELMKTAAKTDIPKRGERHFINSDENSIRN